ncbi:spermidine/putrescine ABC transporter substrate-binding protein [Peptoniphilus sp. MSJ-1]|uniref:Spermidine/putrescine ABC transporter substrate-binding protein n=1 Tax=Peptoniphilus ovalis TaxID=2841503 RepID=A0ABS6FIW3_9FIRM|nr:spermidine/putrescine ABC transporter substrate-binding protein [Peptoniphilus ovalis]MBU5669452.1 spermidine/putrescine ABC transporter substrate-binding protein [Peptoniphilus ovalis]
MKKLILLMSLLISVTLTACGGESKATEEISVYNWGEYIDPEILKDFEKETGIKVNYSTYASNEDLYIKMTQSQDQYDVIVPSDYMIEKLIKEDLLQEVNYENIPNFQNVEDRLKNPTFDPENKYSVPYFWGTVGIVYNKKAVTDPVNSWDILWNEKYANQIIMYNSQRDTIGVALKKLGYSLNSTNEKELQEAKDLLIAQKPLVYAYLDDDGRDVVVQGDANLSVMYSGDALLMIKQNEDLDYVIPKEGSNIWYDSMVIPKNARNVSGAEKFINYMLEKEVQAKNVNYCVGYTSPVKGVKELLPDEIKNSKVAYPDLTNAPELEAFKDLGEFIKVYDRIWTEINASNL